MRIIIPLITALQLLILASLGFGLSIPGSSNLKRDADAALSEEVRVEADNGALEKVNLIPRPTALQSANETDVGPSSPSDGPKANNYYCYRSGQIIDFEPAIHALNECCARLAGYWIPPQSYLYVTVRTRTPGTVMLCQLGTWQQGWIVNFNECISVLNRVQSACSYRDNSGKVKSRGGEGYLPFSWGGPGGLDARWDPNAG